MKISLWDVIKITAACYAVAACGKALFNACANAAHKTVVIEVKNEPKN